MIVGGLTRVGGSISGDLRGLVTPSLHSVHGAAGLTGDQVSSGKGIALTRVDRWKPSMHAGMAARSRQGARYTAIRQAYRRSESSASTEKYGTDRIGPSPLPPVYRDTASTTSRKPAKPVRHPPGLAPPAVRKGATRSDTVSVLNGKLSSQSQRGVRKIDERRSPLEGEIRAGHVGRWQQRPGRLEGSLVSRGSMPREELHRDTVPYKSA